MFNNFETTFKENYEKDHNYVLNEFYATVRNVDEKISHLYNVDIADYL